MDQCEDREEGVPPSTTSVWETGEPEGASGSTTDWPKSAAYPVHPPMCPQASFLQDSLFLNDQAIWKTLHSKTTPMLNSTSPFPGLAAPSSRS
ncbi:hypothetical protein AMECASPLE_023876 [Ameca splendens]|uniref:Uncharacterized protein n=1 Tax=Ameca splendens TaxID=208324 RepID=A0ABV0ZD76_9TELE